MGVTNARGADARLYEKRIGKSTSRLPIVLFAIIFLVIVFGAVMFFLMA
jgi:hypothetical protein